MDSDFWKTRLAAAKRRFNVHNNNRLGHFHPNPELGDLDAEEEVRPDYPCPYCFEEFDIGSLCLHLEDEHSRESKATGCPICSVEVAGSMLSHITLQHGHLFKLQRHRRLRRVPIPYGQAPSMLGRDLREAHFQVLLRGSGCRPNSSTSSTSATDKFLSLVLNSSASDPDDISKSLMSSLEENSSKCVASQHVWKSSYLSSLSREEREERMKQAAGRAVFVQDLLASTLLAD